MSTTPTLRFFKRFSAEEGSSAPPPARLLGLIDTARRASPQVDVNAVTAAVLPHLTAAETATMAQRGLELLAEEVMAEVRQSSDRIGQVGA